MIEDIQLGKYDGELIDIAQAVRDRYDEIGRQAKWRITIDGETWDQDTVTIGEVRLVEATTGVNWSQLSPLGSAATATAFIMAHWHKVNGVELHEAWDKADALSAVDVIAAVSEYESPAGKFRTGAPTS